MTVLPEISTADEEPRIRPLRDLRALLNGTGGDPRALAFFDCALVRNLGEAELDLRGRG
jgi:hypothetical protein